MFLVEMSIKVIGPQSISLASLGPRCVQWIKVIIHKLKYSFLILSYLFKRLMTRRTGLFVSTYDDPLQIKNKNNSIFNGKLMTHQVAQTNQIHDSIIWLLRNINVCVHKTKKKKKIEKDKRKSKKKLNYLELKSSGCLDKTKCSIFHATHESSLNKRKELLHKTTRKKVIEIKILVFLRSNNSFFNCLPKVVRWKKILVHLKSTVVKEN